MIIKRAVLAFCPIILLSRFVVSRVRTSLDLNFQLRIVTKIRKLRGWDGKGWTNFENDNLHEARIAKVTGF